MSSRSSLPTLSELMERATAISGLDEWGDLSFTGTAELLLTSCGETAKLNPLGKNVLRSVVTRHLINRLLTNDYLNARDTPLSSLGSGVVVTGLPRTGTTLLHNLLALDPRGRVLHLWEALHPVPPDPERGPSKSELIEQAGTWLSRLYEMVPNFRAIHAASPTGPEECDALLQNEFASQHFGDMFDAESYSEWLALASLEHEYAAYARQLRVLTNGSSASNDWILKSPSHLGHLDALLSVSQAWRVVHCHRHPHEAIPSYASLIFSLRRAYSDAVSPVVAGRQALSRCQVAMERALAIRRTSPERIVDVSYTRLVEDPIACVRSLYLQLGWEFHEDLAGNMAHWLAGHPQGQNGVHRYDLDQFGITSEEVTDAFQEYLEQFALMCC